MNFNPILFIPSPRDIPEVKKWWPLLPYDKFIVKYTPQLSAYTQGKVFFLSHPEYSHLVMMPDDLEVPPDKLEQLRDRMQFHKLKVISGISNIDEDRPDMWTAQPLGCNFELDHPPSHLWYNRENSKHFSAKLTTEGMMQVGHVGFSCEIIERSVFEKVSWMGSSTQKSGNFDWQFSHDCKDLGVEIWVDTTVKLWHRRKQQWAEAKKIKHTTGELGYSYLLKDKK